MLPTHTFNVNNFILRETDRGLVLRPTFGHALIRFILGTGFYALLAFAFFNIERDLTTRAEKKRVTAADLAILDESTQRQVAALIRSDPRKAVGVQKDADTFKQNLIAERNAEADRALTALRPWRYLLFALGGSCILAGIYLPLVPLWLRVTITRDGDALVIRRNGLFPRTARISLSSVHAPSVERVRQTSLIPHRGRMINHFWRVTLRDAQTLATLFVSSSDGTRNRPPRLTQFLTALRNLAS